MCQIKMQVIESMAAGVTWSFSSRRWGDAAVVFEAGAEVFDSEARDRGVR